MTRSWTTLATVPTREGPLELRRRGEDDFLIVIAGRVLMTSAHRRSELLLAELACGKIADRERPAVLIGGLGMGFTLRAALDALPPAARVTVAEISAVVVEWCRGPLAALTSAAIDDPRVNATIIDVAELIATRPPASLDAILLDLYEGPNPATQDARDRYYGTAALRRARVALAAGGALGVWSEDPDPGFAARFSAAGFDVTTHRGGRGGRQHVVYLGVKRG